MTRAWLDQLTQREIVWLMMQLRDLARSSSWTRTETAQARIVALRAELLARRLEPSASSY